MSQKTKKSKLKIGVIGSGWVGGSYMKDFANRGFEPICYSLEPKHVGNKEKIADCDIVFIGVPTPTTPKGFDDSIVRDVIKNVGKGKIAVIKSTVTPGTTSSIQNRYPDRIILFSPEFLSEASALKDVAEPFSNIVGIAKNTKKHKEAAKLVHSVLPPAKFSTTVSSTEAEIIKYSHNASGFVQVIFFNAMYDIAQSLKCDWSNIQEAVLADPFISNRYARPLHKTGRGAGGSCFIKDFAALTDCYEKNVGDAPGVAVFRSMERKNIDLLKKSKKDLNLLKGVYGNKINK